MCFAVSSLGNLIHAFYQVVSEAGACLLGVGDVRTGARDRCNIEALNNAQRYNYRYTPTYFEVGKNYELGTPFTLKPGGQLVYRKIGRKDLFLVPETNIVYDPGWFLSITFRLMAGQKYPAEANRDKRVPLYVIRQSGGQGNSQLLYVNQQGFLCERVGSYSEPSGDFGPIPTLVSGKLYEHADRGALAAAGGGRPEVLQCHGHHLGRRRRFHAQADA
ncbi:MAG: hypothetical protein IPL70_15990 [Uliginosibacterium sp.]|nr:hypothetical protein [Uliginosibacterium sp.]